MPESSAFRARCGTWHGRDNCRPTNARFSDTYFNTQEIRPSTTDMQLFDEVVIEALQGKDQLRIDEM